MAPPASVFRDEAPQVAAVTPVDTQPVEPPAAHVAPLPQVLPAEPVTPAPVAVLVALPAAPAGPVTQAPVAAPVAVFVLPLDSLQAVAESAGLQWVNSNTDKIRAVRDAMAAEPAPAHVPRERKPTAAVDDGPLVLVETRKDLSQIKLPFDAAQGTHPPV